MKNKIKDYIYQNKEEIITSLCELVKIPSIAQQGDEINPYGKMVDDALIKTAELYTQNGFEMNVNHKECYALYETNKTNKSIGLFAHADVVPVNDDWIYTKPFEPKEVGGKLFGRGIEDNKSGVIGSLFALKALKECGFKLKNDITVFIGGCEETGMSDIETFAENEKLPTVSLVPDSEFPVCCGEKGIAHLECLSRGIFDTVISFKGGKAFNVVLDNVDVELNHSDNLFKEIKEKITNAITDGNVIKFSMKGIPKHAAMPEGSENAAFKAADVLCSLNSLSENDKNILKCIKDVCEKYYGVVVGINKTDVFGKLTCVNGMVDVKEGKMYFTLDVRYGNASTGDGVLNSVKTSVGKYGYDVIGFSNAPGFLIEEKNDVSKAIIETYREYTGQKDAKAYTSGGGTYARHIPNAYAVGTTLVKGKEGFDMPVGHGGIHESDECLDIEGFLSAIVLLAITIYKIDCAL